MYLNDFIVGLQDYSEDVYFYDYAGEFLCKVDFYKLWKFFMNNGTKIKIYEFRFCCGVFKVCLDLGYEEGDDKIISRFISLWN
jgi:hypothetical protein